MFDTAYQRNQNKRVQAITHTLIFFNPSQRWACTGIGPPSPPTSTPSPLGTIAQRFYCIAFHMILRSPCKFGSAISYFSQFCKIVDWIRAGADWIRIHCINDFFFIKFTVQCAYLFGSEILKAINASLIFLNCLQCDALYREFPFSRGSIFTNAFAQQASTERGKY